LAVTIITEFNVRHKNNNFLEKAHYLNQKITFDSTKTMKSEHLIKILTDGMNPNLS